MQPELLQLDDGGLQSLVAAELRSILGLSRPPLFSEVVRFPNAMPQYHVGHLDRVDRIERQLKSFPGLALAGSAWRGVGIPDSISSGRNAADAVLGELHLLPAGTTSF